MTPSPGPPPLWTVEQCAQWIAVTVMSFRCMLRRREIPEEAIVRIGRRVRLRADVFQRWVLQGRAGAA
jgi:hypothetical protein